MKVFIQIPCYNEEDQLEETINAINALNLNSKDNQIDWKILIINDGSTDNTVDIAKKLNVDFIVHHDSNKGLAATFIKGIESCLNLGADIIINTDADNQYSASFIPRIIKPILENKADIVIGKRKIISNFNFTTRKKILQIIGSWVVKILSETVINDAPCGFRSYSRYSASKLIIFDKYTYTLESLFLANSLGLKIINMPIDTNKSLRESRLIKNNLTYIINSVSTIFKSLLIYKPQKLFIFLTLIFLISTLVILLSNSKEILDNSSYIYLIFLFLSFQLMTLSYCRYLFKINRKLMEKVFQIKFNRHKS